ncbi:MAG: T9SS type A sorting domain-containing protein, partial [Bacteroidota bacterium]
LEENTFLGLSAGVGNISGSRNTYVGRTAGLNNTAGSGNIFLGYRSGENELGSNKLYIANTQTEAPLIYGEFDNEVVGINGSLGVGLQNPERPIHLRDERAIFRIDRDRPDPGFAVVRYDQGFQNVWKSFYFYTLGSGVDQGKFIIADWGTDVSGPDHKARLTIDNEGDIGIGARFENLNNNATAKLHVDGTVRFQNLPNGSGDALVIDANGNVRRGSTTSAKSDEVVKLKAEIEELKARLARLESLPGKEEGKNEIPQLFQNRPNPFDQSTEIPFYLPERVEQALILVTDLQGKEIRRFPIKDRGEGAIQISSQSLAKGIYLYTLVVDGKMKDSSRMLVE